MARLKPEDWVSAAQRRLAEEGIDGVRVEALARDLGVSKGSFYWHFESRQALLDALLQGWEAAATLAVIQQVDAAEQEPARRLWALMKRAFGIPRELDLLETEIRAWAARESGPRAVVERVDKQRLAYVAGLLTAAGLPAAEARRRAQILYSTMVGEFFLCSHGAEPLPRAALKSLYAMLLGGT
jgi:AcrR family transcriptional regulator